jgi:hypothetical protein
VAEAKQAAWRIQNINGIIGVVKPLNPDRPGVMIALSANFVRRSNV